MPGSLDARWRGADRDRLRRASGTAPERGMRSMGVRFTADEVLAMAEAIEANAVRFYEVAAAEVPGDDCRKLLSDLARWERGHERTFAEMRASLPREEADSPVFDPDDQAPQYLQALADASVFRPGEDPSLRLGPRPEYRQILMAALELENESIAFYVGMRDLVPLSAGRSRVDAIVDEEKAHLTILNEELARL